MILLNQARKSFRTTQVETMALNAIDLNIDQGAFVAVMGPSGCGKSTLLSIIGMLDALNSGQYLFDGQDVTGFSEKEMSLLRRKYIGYVFQDYNLLASMTVLDNVLLPLKFTQLTKKEKKERAEYALDLVGLEHRREHYPEQMSGGQQQRAALARAIVSNPKLLLADEPTGNLDSKHSHQVLSLLQKINEHGTTILMVTHSKSDAAYTNSIISMFDGAIDKL